MSDDQVLDPDDRGIRDSEAAPILGVKATTLPTWRSKGKGPKFRKSGRFVEYTPRFIREYLESCTRTPEDAKARRKRRALASDSTT
jgi:hypothetical protein